MASRVERSASGTISLQPIRSNERDVLNRLMQLYIHDMSEIFPIEIDAEGLYHYDRLPLDFCDRPDRHAFFICVDGGLAGFVLVQCGSPISDDPDVLDVAEFFIVRRHRRSGVGRRAAFQLWDQLRGTWVVRVSEGNRGGLPFWRSVTAEYSGGAANESTRPGEPFRWRVFRFQSR